MRLLDRHPHLTLFIWIVAAALIAYLAAAGLIGSRFRGYTVGNPIFIGGLVGLIAITGRPVKLSAPDFLVIVLVLILLGAMGFAGLLVADWSPVLARLLAGPITVIGIYPPGPDVWFPLGIALWGVSSVIITAASAFLGTWLHKFRRHDS